MIFLAQNLRYLRKQEKISQQVLAEKLYISRASLAKYECAVNEPSLELLLRISRYFKLTVDMLLCVDMEKKGYSVAELNSFEKQLIMPIQVDSRGDNVIEVVPHHVQAGYQGNYSDPGFIESLDQMALPFHEIHGKCRAFPVEGDSMPPFGSGSYVVGREVLSLSEIGEGKRYIVVSRDQGIVFKRIFKSIDKGYFSLRSDNPKHKPFDMHLRDILEVWEFVAAISFRESSDNYYADHVLKKVKELQTEIQKLAENLRVNP